MNSAPRRVSPIDRSAGCRKGRTVQIRTVPIRTLTVVIATALALSACGGQSRPAAETTSATSATSAASVSSATSASAASAASASVATSASPVGVPAKGEMPSREFVVGKWGTDGDCTLAIDLRPDGTSDGPFGAWTYSDGVISFPDDPEFKVNVTVLDDKTMKSANGDKTSTMTRCP